MSADVGYRLFFKPAVHRFPQVQLSESTELSWMPGVFGRQFCLSAGGADSKAGLALTHKQ